MGQTNAKTCGNVAYFPWWANGPYSPGLGQWAWLGCCGCYFAANPIILPYRAGRAAAKLARNWLKVQLLAMILMESLSRSKGPCDVFDPWVRWERGQVGI